ncbi:HTH_Tnp_Tc3_2 domain-containing protein [Trichonephila clavipes]|nr:HTH_Tnp_Tc3_2 domain-containing protein [Trichonephila clavipes]
MGSVWRIFWVELLDDWNVDVLSWKYSRNMESQSVISRLRQRFQDDGNVSRCLAQVAPQVTTPNEDRLYFLQLLPKETNECAQHHYLLVSSLQLPVQQFSKQTVYRRLGHIGLYARRPVRCVPLTATHMSSCD